MEENRNHVWQGGGFSGSSRLDLVPTIWCLPPGMVCVPATSQAGPFGMSMYMYVCNTYVCMYVCMCVHVCMYLLSMYVYGSVCASMFTCTCESSGRPVNLRWCGEVSGHEVTPDDKVCTLYTCRVIHDSHHECGRKRMGLGLCVKGIPRLA